MFGEYCDWIVMICIIIFILLLALVYWYYYSDSANCNNDKQKMHQCGMCKTVGWSLTIIFLIMLVYIVVCGGCKCRVC